MKGTIVERAQAYLKETCVANADRRTMQSIYTQESKVDELAAALAAERLKTDAAGQLKVIDELLAMLRKLKNDIANLYANTLINSCPDAKLKTDYATLQSEVNATGQAMTELQSRLADQQTLIEQAEREMEVSERNYAKFPNSSQERSENERISRVLESRREVLAKIQAEVSAKQAERDALSEKLENHKALMRAA